MQNQTFLFMQCDFPIDRLLSENLTFLYLDMEEKKQCGQVCLYNFSILIKRYNREELQNLRDELLKGESTRSYLVDIYLQMIEHQLKCWPIL